MSLKVWLPLNGDLENKGCSNVEVVNNGATLDNNGKIGKCYSFPNSSNGTLTFNQQISLSIIQGVTITAWIYLNGEKTDRAFFSNQSGGPVNFSFEINNNKLSVYHYISSWQRDTSTTTLLNNTWYHIAYVCKNNQCTCYINGIPDSPINCSIGTNYNGNIPMDRICSRWSGGAPFYGKINDFRIYDHALSAAEVKEISQGLVLHYKLNDVIQSNLLPINLENVNNWTASGATKSYDNGIKFSPTGGERRIYISCSNVWIENGGKYTVSLEAKADTNNCILQASRSIADYAPNFILTTDWKYYSGVITLTGTSTSGTLSLQGPVGSTIWIRNVKVEKGEIATPYIIGNNNTVQDSSGYNNNGIILNTISISSDTPRYSASTKLETASSMINCGRGGMVIDSITVNLWFKTSSWSNPVSCTESGGWNFEAVGDYFRFPVYISGVGYKYGQSTTTRAQLCNNQWHMLTGIYDRINQKIKIYVDGQLDNDYSTGTSNNIGYNGTNVIWIGAEATSSNTEASNGMAGLFSDFRIYCTPLLDNDIKMLYNTSMSIDDLNNVHSFEFESNQNNEITKTGISKNDIIEPYITLKDGSYWKLLLFHYVDRGNNLFTSSNATYCNDFGLYSRLREINNYTYGGKYEYYVNQDGKEFRWTQTSSPTASSISGKTVISGYLDPVNGLAKPSSLTQTYIGYNTWWGACGCWTSFTTGGKTGIPGFGSHDGNGICENYLALYTRIEKDKVFLEKSFINASNFIEK